MSQRLSRIALPVFRVSAWASSSQSRSTRSATRCRRAARSVAGDRGQSVVSKARRAAAMACWTCSSVATSTSVTTVASDGLMTGLHAPSPDATHAPSMNRLGTATSEAAQAWRARNVVEDGGAGDTGQRHVAGDAPCRATRALALRPALANKYASVGTSRFGNRVRLRQGRLYLDVEADVTHVRFELGGGHLLEIGRSRVPMLPSPSSHGGNRVPPKVERAQPMDHRRQTVAPVSSRVKLAVMRSRHHYESANVLSAGHDPLAVSTSASEASR